MDQHEEGTKQMQGSDGRLLDTGDKLGDLEVTAVSYSEHPETGEHQNFEYHLKHPDDIVKAPEHGVELTQETARPQEGSEQDGQPSDSTSELVAAASQQPSAEQTESNEPVAEQPAEQPATEPVAEHASSEQPTA